MAPRSSSTMTAPIPIPPAVDADVAPSGSPSSPSPSPSTPSSRSLLRPRHRARRRTTATSKARLLFATVLTMTAATASSAAVAGTAAAASEIVAPPSSRGGNSETLRSRDDRRRMSRSAKSSDGGAAGRRSKSGKSSKVLDGGDAKSSKTDNLFEGKSSKKHGGGKGGKGGEESHELYGGGKSSKMVTGRGKSSKTVTGEKSPPQDGGCDEGGSGDGKAGKDSHCHHHHHHDDDEHENENYDSSHDGHDHEHSHGTDDLHDHDHGDLHDHHGPPVPPSSPPVIAPTPATLDDYFGDPVADEVVLAKCGKHTPLSRSLGMIKYLGRFLTASGGGGDEGLYDRAELLADQSPGNPYYRAFLWLTYFDALVLCPPPPDPVVFDEDESLTRNRSAVRRIVQRYSLAVTYYSLVGDEWTDCRASSAPAPGGCATTAARFLDPVHECEWFGVSCDEGSAGADADADADVDAFFVSEIRLPSNNLAGTLPPELYDAFGDGLSIDVLVGRDNGASDDGRIVTSGDASSPSTSLRVLQMNDNHIAGPLSAKVGSMTSLEVLRLDGNALEGMIPFEALSSLLNLKILTFGNNEMTGDAVHFCGADGLFAEDGVGGGRTAGGGGTLIEFETDCLPPADGAEAPPPRVECNCCTRCT